MPQVDDLVLVERSDDGIAVVTLNRPQAMNALSAALRSAIAEAMQALEADDAVRVVILTGAGRAFCAGLDLKELEASTEGLADQSAADLIAAIAAFSGPVIAAINGFAITGGLELALACDILIASAEARFADTHAQVGFLPNWGLSQKLSRMIGIHRAKEMALTGNAISASQAEDWGLVNRVVEADALLDTARTLARDMLAAAPGMLAAHKRLIDDGFAVPFGAAVALEHERARPHNARVTAESVRSRRAAVQAHGRADKSVTS